MLDFDQVVFRALILGLALSAAVAGGASASRTASAQVTVTFTDKGLRATPMTPSSGPTTFLVVNKGKKTHLLEVKGPGVKGARTRTLAAGAIAKLTVTLRPGAYVLSDPVGLGVYQALFLDVVKATTVGGTGSSNTVQPEPQVPPMCGSGYTP